MIEIQLSIIIPCYNEVDCLKKAYDRISIVCKKIYKREYEIIFVNDGSTDFSRNILSDLVNLDDNLIVVEHSRNFGQQAAILSGLRISKGNKVLIIDADMQDPPELLPEMISIMNQGFDVVYGLREEREGETIFKVLTSKLFYRIMSMISDVYIPKDVGDFRLINKKIVHNLLSLEEAKPYIRGMIAWLGFKQTFIRYKRLPRIDGKSNYSLSKMINFGLDGLTSFSIYPLRIINILALSSTIISLILSLYYLIGFLYFNVVKGWTSIVVLILFIGSIQLLAIGIIGEYIGRILIQSKNRPNAIINNIYKKNDI